MAKKLDVNIDAGNFLEAFRPELPPSATRRDSGKETGNGAAAEPTRESGGEKRARPVKQTTVPIEEEYLERFIRTSRTPARSGKMAYVCKEYHDRIMRIVQVIGKGELSLSGYIDHVLTQHFIEYEEAIKKLYKKNYEDVY